MSKMELQIRSLEIHNIAEYGVASHWIIRTWAVNFLKKEIKRKQMD